MKCGSGSGSMWRLRVDTGGTFTDGWGMDPAGRERRVKILSTGRIRTAVERVLGARRVRMRSDCGAGDGVLEGFASADGARVTRWEQADRTAEFDRPVNWAEGTVVELATGEEAPVVAARLLTGTGIDGEFPSHDFRLATTKGTNALLERKGKQGVLFVTAGFEDVLRIGDQRRPSLFARRQVPPPPVFERTAGVAERIGADGRVLVPLDADRLREEIAALREEGITVAAVSFLNSYANPAHERLAGELLEAAGFGPVSLSHELTPGPRLLSRAETAAANAYLAPVMHRFVRTVAGRMGGGCLSLMTSAGALKPAGLYRPVDSLLSGPAGGTTGALAAAMRAGFERVLTFDMGGTSTDVARLDGAPRYRYEQRIGPVRVVAPAVRIESVAAGGGSICRWHNGGLEVGPESAGADPGPACYGKGGPLTITDVNLLLGCMAPEAGSIPLDPAAARDRLGELRAAMARDGAGVAGDEVLLEGLREIAVERMAEAIRKVSLREGYDPSDYALVAFGGAGPQHACAVARKLGVREILVPGDAGLLSAWGLHRAAREEMVERQILAPLSECRGGLGSLFAGMGREALAELGGTAAVSRHLVEMRIRGQDAALEIEFPEAPNAEELAARFAEKYESLFGYALPKRRELEVVAVRVVAAEAVEDMAGEEFEPFGGEAPERVVMQDAYRTAVLEPGWACAAGTMGSLRFRRSAPEAGDAAVDSWSPEVEAELFRCRFESVAEEMGELLRRTAISTNIKERLDFSCALLDARGRLIVNAPHIPVHLGALGLCVREISRGRDWKEGDMVVVNHPGFGGSHLPDVTVVSPVFAAGCVAAFVANRAHHAELGGRSPGSMPAGAVALDEEGVVIPPALLFDSGVACIDEVEELFRSARYPSRALADNLADLAAQAAANRHGVAAMQKLIATTSARQVAENMERLYQRAAGIMRVRAADLSGGVRRAADAMDDGSPLRVAIGWEDGRLVVDFEGSGPCHPGNLNATPAIVRSAVLYVLRVWAEEDLPLNEGLLEGVEVRLPPGILDPPFVRDPAKCPAVVGGNIETSQRLVDILLEALELQAHSQGTMNNLLFGTARFGYYETIGGGSGAGPGWDGLSGTHVHMSNTSITDAEILERRYPVRVREFALRRGSGGPGRWRGGDGLVREIEFLAPLTVSLLTQRRVLSPRGLRGGADGTPGRQTLMRPDGSKESLPPIATFEAQPGDRLRIETPGGGGWGTAGK